MNLKTFALLLAIFPLIANAAARSDAARVGMQRAGGAGVRAPTMVKNLKTSSGKKSVQKSTNSVQKAEEDVEEYEEDFVDEYEDIAAEDEFVEEEFVEEKINSLFNQFSKDSEVYVTYNVFILRDGDSLDTIMEKYNVTQEELDNLKELHKYSVELKNTLNQLSEDLNSGRISWGQLTKKGSPVFAQEVSNISKDSFSNLEENFHEYAGLIYDGAFSEHMTNPERKGLTGDEIDEETAKKVAEELKYKLSLKRSCWLFLYPPRPLFLKQGHCLRFQT